MSSTQTIITMGAFMLLTFAVFNTNRMLGEADITLAQDRYKLEALSVMNSYMERATNNNFDEASVDTNVTFISDPTAVCVPTKNLGFDAGESVYGDIDDFDDFVSLSPFIETGRSGVEYVLIFEVEYVSLSGGHFVHSNSQTYNKRMKISIYDNYASPLIYTNTNTGIVKDTMAISFVYSHWYRN